ncbi:hypothetical protein B617_gp26 [Nonlabens phage P12024S]|uniref:Uncharacterized protein n=1 Tax=Nonlabens phage P12024S TaxID=1168478 RepID=I6S2D1_9CAUD|nr:hypothetical protein B617_gp26 [Nonlabens phage P12024S]AFM54687.1 hypothetical protein P12024S_26 [Nonlabens phage P12024S]
MNLLTKYNSLDSRDEKRLFCIEIDKENKYKKELSYKKVSLFSINVYFERLTGFKVNEDRKRRDIRYKDERKF